MNDADAIYAVDDDEAVLLSVHAMLKQHGYAARCFSSAAVFLAEAPLDRPGCVITDVQMPEINGIELQQRLLDANSPLSVVVVTGVADVPMAVSLMESGAITLLEKPYNHHDLLRAVERGLAASHRRSEHQAIECQAHDRLAALTEEERNVLDCMLAGHPNKMIAHRLDMSMRTVDRRRHAVLEKMGVKSAPELALLVGIARRPQS
jgi:two-component system, LuxR family, response regulator FixJ